MTGVVFYPSSVFDKGDGRRLHTGGLVNKKGDGSLVKSITYYVTYVMGRQLSPFCFQQRRSRSNGRNAHHLKEIMLVTIELFLHSGMGVTLVKP